MSHDSATERKRDARTQEVQLGGDGARVAAQPRKGGAIRRTSPRGSSPRPPSQRSTDIDHEMNERQAEFLDWWVTPDKDKVPRYIAEWCREHDISEESVRRWRKNDWWDVALRKRLSELNVSPDRVQQVIDALFATATDRESKQQVQAARVLLEYTQQLMPVQPVLAADRTTDMLSDDEVEAEYARMLLEDRKQRARDSLAQGADVQPEGAP